MLKLQVEIVPSSCFYSNVRSEVSKKQWDLIRRKTYSLANNRCEICGGQGRKHPVEAHEVWDYIETPTKNIQKLVRMIALCPLCHESKHVGLAQMRGRMQQVLVHMSIVNRVDPQVIADHIEEERLKWVHRSRLQWELDISYLDQFLSD